ncbi:MAG: metal-dependent transcriptional regulator [Candidatus Makaraimicrobium thalassicum]|nr:MAG: metal-dependent transcriptional regulator [Candidatus Omnitrophota bacterium]
MSVKVKKGNKKLSSNMEDYLEAIAVLKKDRGVARVGDISRLVNVKKPSVTSALSVLSGKGLVVHERYGYVEFTPKGKIIARGIKKRHDMFVRFLVDVLGIDSQTAAEDACRMEHTVSSETFENLTKFIEFVDTHPDGDRPEWLKRFDHYSKTGKRLKCTIKEAGRRAEE